MSTSSSAKEDSASELDEATNPFAENDSLKPTIDMSSVCQRGALISGTQPSVDESESPLREEPTSREDSSAGDLECGSSDRTSSEYGIHTKRSLWEPSTNSDNIRHHASRLQETNESEEEKKRKKSLLWVALALVAVILVGVVVAIGVVMFGGGDDGQSTGDGTTDGPPVLTNRQQMLHDIVKTVSNSGLFTITTTPQHNARKWLLFEDELWLSPEGEVSRERVIQRYVLAVFYYATAGPTAWEANNWLRGDECADGAFWDGIFCNDENKVITLAFGKLRPLSQSDQTFRVISDRSCARLIADRQGLVGKIPQEVGHLDELVNLVLKNDYELQGTIPSTVGKLTNLRQFGIYYCKLSGSIPNELFLAKKLKYLNLQDNNLSGTLSPDIGNLRELETLVLANNDIEGEVPFESMAFGFLRYLGLSSNRFSGELKPAIGYYPKIRYLYLDHNQFRGQLPLSLGSASNLRSINVDHNDISGVVIPDLGRLRQLEYLSMQSNNLAGSIPTELRLVTSLETINLDSNKITGEIPDISTLINLKKLVLSRNQLEGPIPDLSNLSSLGM